MIYVSSEEGQNKQDHFVFANGTIHNLRYWNKRFWALSSAGIYRQLSEENDGYLELQSIWPNPFSESTSLCFEGSDSSSIDYFIINSVGQEVKTGNLDIVSGVTVKKIDFNSLAHGLYYLKILIDDEWKTYKLIKN